MVCDLKPGKYMVRQVVRDSEGSQNGGTQWRGGYSLLTFVSRKSYGSDPAQGKQRALQDDNARSQCGLVAIGKKSLTREGASYRFYHGRFDEEARSVVGISRAFHWYEQ